MSTNTNTSKTNDRGGTSLDPRAHRRRERRDVLAMVVPMVITTSSRAFMDVADYAMITGLHVPEAQAAILPGQIIMWSYIILGVGIVSLISTFVSQSLGRGELRECSAYGWQSVYIAAFFGLVGAILLPLLPQLIGFFGHEPSVQTLELSYTRVAVLGVAPTIVAYGIGWFFVGIHRPMPTMWSAIEANVVNITVGYVLIFGRLGFEPMGLTGAAWATIVAVSYRALRLVLTMLLSKATVQFEPRRTWRPSWSRLVRLLRVGLPFGLQWLSDVAVWAIFVNVLIGKMFLMPHLIATNTAWQYMRVAFMPIQGLGQALQALVGRSIGAGDAARAVRDTKAAALMTLAYTGAWSIVFVLFGDSLIHLFNADPQVVAIGRGVMICAALFQMFDGLGMTYSAALRGAGDTFVPSVVFVVSNWLFVVAGGWFMAVTFPQLGSWGPWSATCVLFVTTGLFLWVRWRRGGWRNRTLFGAAHSPQTGETCPVPLAPVPAVTDG